MSDGGKGSARRKENSQAVRDGWERIFGSGKNKTEEPKMELDDDDCFDNGIEDDQDWTCDVCGGPMYAAPHWTYGKCDDCGATQELESDI